MKTIITFAFLSAMLSGYAQDTLNCKKDLKYDKKQGFYYKKGDEAKTPVSGNAICFPKRGMVNRGKLVNGKWDGTVYGYKKGHLIGKSNYKNGVQDGLRICYAENGKTKDSLVYRDGNVEYAYKARYNKAGSKTREEKVNVGNNTSEIYVYETVNNISYTSEIKRLKATKKDGLQEYMQGESDAPGSLFTYTYQEDNYENGKLKTRTYYNKGKKYQVDDYVDGKLTMQNDITNGLVTASYPLKCGKKHGTAVIYDKNGKNPVNEEYKRGNPVVKK